MFGKPTIWHILSPARKHLFAALALVLSLSVACSSQATATPAQTPAPLAEASNAGELKPILATKVLNVGAQRVAFLLTSPKALIKVPEVTVSSVFVEDGQAAVETRQAGFHLWPYGVRGSYVTEFNFDRPGRWRLDIEVEAEGETQIELEVTESGGVPQVGSIPPLSNNKTLPVVGELPKLTTAYAPDPDLYQVTIADAVATSLPTVVVFASPAFCTSPTCGPQTETLSELKEAHVGEANFIHVEIYDNPDEIQGDLSRGTLSQPVQDWGISAIPGWFNESWTFVLDPEGRVNQRFEGYATLDELEEALRAVLAPA